MATRPSAWVVCVKTKDGGFYYLDHARGFTLTDMQAAWKYLNMVDAQYDVRNFSAAKFVKVVMAEIGVWQVAEDSPFDPMAKPIEDHGGELTRPDPVNHPRHYTSHPSGIECIQVTEHMGFNLGNAVKYIWRADEKGNAIEDLKKAVWYLQREITKREKNNAQEKEPANAS